MEQFNLGIFDDLAGYLTAAYLECGPSVDSCDPNKSYSRYYLQKYYRPRPSGARDEDVVPQFTNAVVKLAQKIKTFDMSLGAAPTLKNLLLRVAEDVLNKVVVTSSDNTLDMLVTDLNNSLTDRASVASTDITVNELNTTVKKNLMDELVNAIDRSGLLPAETKNAKDCLNGPIGKKVGKKDVCVGLDLNNLGVTMTLSVVVVDGTSNLTDSNTTRTQVKKAVIDAVKGKIGDWIKANYDVSGLRNTYGDQPNVAKALTNLRNGTVNPTEMQIFNDFFNVMTKDEHELTNLAEIDLSKLDQYRINCKMSDYTGLGSVPSVIALIPKLRNQTVNVRYNDGTVLVKSTENILKEVFAKAYSGDVKTVLPSFNGTGSTDLRPDLEALMRDILMRDTSVKAHVDDDDTEEIGAVLSSWRRVGTDTWEHTLDDGSTVVVRPNSKDQKDIDMFNQEITREVSNCASVGFSSDPERCASFLRNVALDNTQELANVASQLNEDVAKEVVKNLHPKFALAILKAFGFRRKMCTDRVAGRKIEKIQRVKEWQEKFLEKKFTDKSTVASIKTNTKLLAFLDLLAQLVNGNPSILNDNMVVETEESRGEEQVPEELAVRKIKAAGRKTTGRTVLGWNEITNGMSQTLGSFSRGLTFNGVNTNSPFGMDNLFPQITMLSAAPVVRGSTWGGMVGGSSELKVFLNKSETGLEYSHHVQKILKDLIGNLERANKSLSQEDAVNIARKMQQFEMLERELYETARNIQNYSRLLKVVETENRPEIITYKHIERFTEKYNGLLNRYEKTGNSFNTLISLLKDCVEDKENDERCRTL